MLHQQSSRQEVGVSGTSDNMKVVCVFFGALVAATHGQAYVSYYGQDLHHPVLSKESNSQEEAQLYHKNTYEAPTNIFANLKPFNHFQRKQRRLTNGTPRETLWL